MHIDILGTNDPAVIGGVDSKSLTEANAAAAISTSGQLTISDVDSPATFQAQSNTAGQYGSFSIDASGAWSYSASSAHDEFVGGQIPIKRVLTGWQLDLFRCLERIPSNTFDIADVYRFAPDLQKKHPSNKHIREKIRQQLQYLRNFGLVEFRGEGAYRKLWQEKD